VAEQVGDRPAAKARRVPGQSLTWIRLCVGEAPPSMAKPSVDGVGTGGWGAGPDQAARHLRRHVDRTGAGSAIFRSPSFGQTAKTSGELAS
jgi:hypothetical protein